MGMPNLGVVVHHGHAAASFVSRVYVSLPLRRPATTLLRGANRALKNRLARC